MSSEVPPEGPVYRFEDFELDPRRRELRRAGQALAIEPKVFAVLAYLIEHADRVVSKRELRETLWPGEALSEGVLSRSVWGARRAVGDDGKSQRAIRTVQRHGYRFVAPLAPRPPEAGQPACRPAADREGPRPDPVGLGTPAGVGFVGRQQELTTLDRGLQAALRGTARTVLVSGEAGAGKSRLIEEFGLLAARRGSLVLTGRLAKPGRTPPYGPWRDLLGPVFRERPRAELEAALGEHAPALVGVFPELAERLPNQRAVPLDAADGAFRVTTALARLLRRLAEARPLVCVLEDLHWADPSSLRLVRHLSETRDGRLLVLASFRTHDLRRDAPQERMRDELVSNPNVLSIQLEGLAPEDCTDLCQLAAGRSVGDDWAKEIVRRSDGNPLTVIELVRLLDERGALDRPPRETATLPTGVHATIERRLDQLSDPCVRALSCGAIFGRSFQVDRVARVGELAPEALLAALDEATHSHIVEERSRVGGHYRFRHALLYELSYQRLSASDRVRLHQRAGRMLEELYAHSSDPPLAELLHHFSQSPFHDDLTRAVEYGRQAAEEALRMQAYPEAIALYERALESLSHVAADGDPRNVDLLYGLGMAERGSGNHTAAMESFAKVVHRARVLEDRELFARGVVSLEEARYTARADPGASILLLEEALDRVPRGPSPLTRDLLNRLAGVYNVVNDPRRLEVSARAVEAARTLGDPLALAQTLITRHVAIWGPDSLDERLAIGDELISLADRVGSGTDSFGLGARIWGHERRMSDMLEIGDRSRLLAAIEGARVELEALTPLPADASSERINEDTRLAVHVEHHRLFRGMLLVMEGKFVEAEKLALDVAAASQRIQAGNVLAGVQIQLFGLRYLQGRVDEVVGLMQAVLTQNPNFGTATRAALAMALADLGRAEEADTELRRIAADGFAALPRDAFWVSTLATCAEAAFLAGSSWPAAELLELLRPYADRTVMASASYCTGSVSRPLGMLATLLGDTETATQHFEAALEKNRALLAEPFIAMTEHAYACALLGGSSERARERLASCIDIASRLGMRRLEERARGLAS